jgi:hypothetical protein
MKSELTALAAIIIIIAIGWWYFTQTPPTNRNPLQNATQTTPTQQPPALSIQNTNPSYNDSDALNNLISIVNPMASVLSGLGFLNDSNASNVLNEVVSNLASFESNENLSTLSDKGFFITYAGATAELATANQDYLNFLMIQNNQTTSNQLCGDKQTYLRSLFFLNKSIQEVLNASNLLNTTLSIANYAALSNETHVNDSVAYLQAFALELQAFELKQESNIKELCG